MTANTAPPLLLNLDESDLIEETWSSDSCCRTPVYNGPPVVDVDSCNSAKAVVYDVEGVNNDQDYYSSIKASSADAASLPHADASLVEEGALLLPLATEMTDRQRLQPETCSSTTTSSSSCCGAAAGGRRIAASSPLHMLAATAHPVGYARPEFIFVRVRRGCEEAEDRRYEPSLGLFLKRSRKGGQAYVSRIASDSIFAHAAANNLLCPGDEILAVNSISCRNKTAKQVAMLLQEGGLPDEDGGDESERARRRTYLSVLVHNRRGDPNLVSSCIQKPDPDGKVGVWFTNIAGSLVVSRVDNDCGLFADTLLAGGHRCVAINGVDTGTTGVRAAEAARMIGGCGAFVNIVSRPRDFNGALVLCCERRKDWWERLAVAFAESAKALAAMETLT